MGFLGVFPRTTRSSFPPQTFRMAITDKKKKEKSEKDHLPMFFMHHGHPFPCDLPSSLSLELFRKEDDTLGTLGV